MWKVLVANRGEIAIRIFRSAIELGWQTVALYTNDDASHTAYADEVVLLDSPSQYMDPEHLVQIAHRTKCTHVHPGYGFLSEDPRLASLLSHTNITFVGPSEEGLKISSNKMLSREFAASLGLSIAPGGRVSSAADVRRFVGTMGSQPFPVIIKALDGGGGRGIRVVHGGPEIEGAFDRFQKMVEIAPSTLPEEVVRPLLAAALDMARHLRYSGLGTFEFLVNSQSHEWVFMEINPRIQVEHTITEEIMNLDLVRIQLLLSIPGTSLADVLPQHARTPLPPRGYAIQLRLIAEDPRQSFKLSTGHFTPSTFSWPSGRGVRVDTWLTTGPSNMEPLQEYLIGTDFDSLLAKLIVHGDTHEEARSRALRALGEVRIPPDLKTNVNMLAGVMKHPHWKHGKVHTTWLESHFEEVMDFGQKSALGHPYHSLSPTPLAFNLTQLSSFASSSQLEFANPQESTHVASPLAGKIVELHPALLAPAGSEHVVRRGETLAVVSVMKMENVISAPSSGKAKL
ncbi:carboxylase:pyruvate/acetyl-coa/propionyl-CoA [Epithele typhae]|uniref:carboxylase:pyruvate/acetyl-coa/propionyl-CoA n=1 Tax=Epithele typhae TaxID=378194 RepID=UPI002007D79F|nr:carboxylase:pyruvate/acetyl-coa/propionyl-CoA [Epithele typhae]KAH9941152.1 carboxylase:pyruvate/acetyl-coa/propionyl-CoA [Epithele typhae]